MGFLGLPIPSIRVFSDNSDEPESPNTPVDSIDNHDLTGAQRSFESLRLHTSKLSSASNNSSNTQTTGTPVDRDRETYPTDDDKPFDPLSHLILKRVGSESLKSQHTGSAHASTTPVSMHSAGFPTTSTAANQSPSVSSTTNNNPSIKDDGLTRTSSSNATRFLSSGSYPSNPREHASAESFSNNRKSPTPSASGAANTSRSTNSGNSGFFSKLLKSSSSARPTSDDENDTTTMDKRQEGWNADVFGYVPNYPIPPKYIHVRAHHKQKREMTRVFLAQQLTTYQNKKKTRGLFHHENHSKNTDVGSIRNDDDNKSNGLGEQIDGSNGPILTSGAIWCAKFSQDGKYLATAGEDKVVRVWQVLASPKDREDDAFEEENSGNSNNNNNNNNTSSSNNFQDSSDEDDGESLFSRRRANSSATKGGSSHNGSGCRSRVYAPVFKTKPVREYYGHTSDVLDISWSKNNFLLSSSMDKTVRLWHVDRAECLCSFLHSDFVTSIQFHPTDDRFFLSGSLDCKLRLWSIPDKEVAYWKDVPDLITAVAFTPDGLTGIAGCFGGQCLFYETDGLKFQSQMHVRSSRGKNSKGSKITGIETFLLPSGVRYQGSFDSEVKLLISTNDSRIRVYNFHDKTMDTKFKGHENLQSQIHASFSDNGQYIISGSEDDRTYVWKMKSSRNQADHKKKDVCDYEYFHSNRSPVTVAIFAPTSTKKLLALSDDPVYDLCDPPPVRLMPREEYSSMAEDFSLRQAPNSKRSSHSNGNIIITADRDGIIKIFRQDCAYEARKAFSESTSLFATSTRSKRLSTLSPTHSWRDSISLHRTRSGRGSSPQPSGRIPRVGGGNSLLSSSYSMNNNIAANNSPYRYGIATGMSSPASSPSGSRRESIGDGVAVQPMTSPTSGASSGNNSQYRKGRPPMNPLSNDGSSDDHRNLSDISIYTHRNGRKKTDNKQHNDDSNEGTGNKIEDEVKCVSCSSTSFKAKRVDGRMSLACSNCGSIAPS